MEIKKSNSMSFKGYVEHGGKYSYYHRKNDFMDVWYLKIPEYKNYCKFPEFKSFDALVNYAKECEY